MHMTLQSRAHVDADLAQSMSSLWLPGEAAQQLSQLFPFVFQRLLLSEELLVFRVQIVKVAELLYLITLGR